MVLTVMCEAVLRNAQFGKFLSSEKTAANEDVPANLSFSLPRLGALLQWRTNL